MKSKRLNMFLMTALTSTLAFNAAAASNRDKHGRRAEQGVAKEHIDAEQAARLAQDLNDYAKRKSEVATDEGLDGVIGLSDGSFITFDEWIARDSFPDQSSGEMLLGACCNAESGECTDDTEFCECVVLGGSWSPEANCADISCPPIGACCNPVTAECADDAPPFDCIINGGIWTADTACSEVACPPTGACCDPLAQTCTDDVPLLDCATNGGLITLEASCADIECPPDFGSGACCQEATGACTDDVEFFACGAEGGISSVGLTCADVQCPPVIPLGACCEEASGICTDDQPAFECTFLMNGNWLEGRACADISCPPIGACCDVQTGQCADGAQEGDCANGLWTADASCDAVACPAESSCGVFNASFETGAISPWMPQDLSIPFFALTVDGAGVASWFAFFTSQPTDGDFAALHGWDGSGPGTIELAQDITLPADATELRFDYRAAWDLMSFCALEDRTFEVIIEPAGGGPPLGPPQLVLTAEAGTMVPDTGDHTAAVDVSAWAGSDVRLRFSWFVPETFSGPAFFQLDNIRCTDPCACEDGKVTICHRPPGNPANAKTKRVGCSALPAHLAHGDSCGPCD